MPGITAALAGAASIQQSLTLRGVSRSVAFITLAQGTENTNESNLKSNESAISPISNPSADTLVYYMGRKDAAKIAQQLIATSKNHHQDTPVQILEAVSTKRERLWSSTLEELAAGKADNWFDSNSPALIMVGEALREKQQTSDHTNQKISELNSFSSKVNDGLQDGVILTDSRRSA